MSLHLSLVSLLTTETTEESLMDLWYLLTNWLLLR